MRAILLSVTVMITASCATSGIATGPNYGLTPTYGSHTISSGQADVLHIRLMSGGPNDAARRIGGSCVGFIANAPDYRVYYSSQPGLPLAFRVESPHDTTLVINGPNGNWYCNDDSVGLDPEFVFSNAVQGQYDVWVGSYGTDAYLEAALTVTPTQTTAPTESPEPGPELDPTSSGTGFFITDSGHLVTSAHVIEDRQNISVRFAGELVRARVLAVDPANDIAVLKIDRNTEPLVVTSARRTQRGEEVFALGYPLSGIQGRTQRAAFGRVNALAGIGDDQRFIQVDAPVLPGNSGGPLINEQGEVVGIIAGRLDAIAVFERSGSLPENVSYAVKSDYLLALVPASVELDGAPLEGDLRDMVSQAESSVVQIIAE